MPFSDMFTLNGTDNTVNIDHRKSDSLSTIEYSSSQTTQPTSAIAVPSLKKGDQLDTASDLPSSPRSFNSRYSGRFRARAATLDGSSRMTATSPLRNGGVVLNQLPNPIENSPSTQDIGFSDSESSEDESTMRLFSALNPSRSDGDLSKLHNQNKVNRRTSFRRPTSGTGRYVDAVGPVKSSLMRIGQRRRSFPSNIHQAGLTRQLSGSFFKSVIDNDISVFDTEDDQTALVPTTIQSPSIDLNKASINHAHIFLDQLLEFFRLPKKWHDILMKPLLLCAENIDLDVKGGDSIDIRHYVKIKRIPGGSSKNTAYVDGTVFSKSLALKSMPRKIKDPRILLITFPIEYSRTDQRFMSLDPVLAQESEYIKKLVKRIVSLNPQVLISSSRISGLAIELLAREGIAVVANSKLTAISRISRYTHADILTSIDRLAMNPRLGNCSMFEVNTYQFKDTAKTFIFISGVPRELGCTIVLRGSDTETLGSVKAVVEFLVYVVFNLKLETSLMRDQFVFIPSDAVSLENKPESHNHANDGGYFHDLIRSQEGKVISSSPFVHFGNPYLLQEARALEDQLVATGHDNDELLENGETDFNQIKKSLQEMGFDDVPLQEFPGGSEKAREIVSVINEERLGTLRDLWASQKRQWELYYSQAPGMFDPFHRQSISLLFSVVCSETRTPCVGPEQTEIDFYSDSDTTLGQFVETMCITADEECPDGCKYRLRDHFRSYVNGTGRLTVRVEKFECKLPGLQNTILMWSHCKVCQNTMPVLPMSAATWKYSFGKYLELAFYSTKLSFRAGQCVHNLYRDHVRYFGFHDLAVRFEYDCIKLLEIIPPQWKMQWKPEISAKHKIEVYHSISAKVNNFWNSVLDRLDRVVIDELAPEKMEECQARIDFLRSVATDERAAALGDLNQIFTTTHVTDILAMNAIVRVIQELVVKWDAEFLDFENKFFPSEKDITRITAQHLKKIFLTDESVDQSDRTDTGTDVPPTPIVEKDDPLKSISSNAEKINESVEETSEKPDMVPVDIEPTKSSNTLLPEPVKLDDRHIALAHREVNDTEDVKERETILEALKLADIYNGQGEIEKAIAMYNLYLDGHSKLTPHDFDSKYCMALQNLAVCYKNQNQLDLAEKIYNQLLQAREIQLGDSDLETLRTMYDLGIVYRNQEKMDLAVQMLRRSLDGRIKISGHNSKDVISTAQELVDIYTSQSMNNEVQEMLDILNRTSNKSSEKSSPDIPSNKPRFDPIDSGNTSLESKTPQRSDTRSYSISPEKRIAAPLTRRPNSISSLSRPTSPRKDSRVLDQVLMTQPSDKDSTLEAIRSSITSPRQDDLFRRPVIPGKGSSIPTLVEVSSTSNIPLSQAAGLRNNDKKPKFRSDEIASFSGVGARKKFLSSRFGTREFENQLFSGKAVGGKTRVSSLAKHFDQLSMEFEKERARERKLLAQGRFRAFPVTKSRPIVEVFKNVKEAVEEVSDEEDDSEPLLDQALLLPSDRAKRDSHCSHESIDTANGECAPQPDLEDIDVDGHTGSSGAGDESPKATSVDEAGGQDDASSDGQPDIASSRETLDSERSEGPEFPPTAEKQSLMQSLANFWADRSATGWNALEYPLKTSEHIFADSDVIVREDEPSSLIAFCLSSPDYLERMKNRGPPPPIEDLEDEGKHVNFERPPKEELEQWMLKKTGIHLKYQFQEGSARLSCKLFFSEQFAAFRKKCLGSDKDYIQSLARCIKWDSSGGKSGSAFLKTLDDRLVVKELSQSELDAFVKFAPSYFKYMAQALFHDLPTVLAKIFGFYQIQIRNPITGKTFKMDVVVMENLFYQHKMSRIFDLKGSMRNRHVQQTGRENEVLLDENMVEYIYESPLFVREHSKRLLKNSLFNDTLFLAKMNVMDYSLVIGIDEEENQLVVGIIGKY
ncbi:1-phosphatidylinositol-3-phosphate 5-kinase [Sugiyamaella lignohabitans]|uniref:1-phosphatidylinositol-3-phosphate 5-kinase n=1 Tax=Sugiyamaella lignohabitans TaxID=796027 RepID=A0A167FPC1_9ASCO|nr:1-phosphatidylinositol-3-phosphate 5-kinase [Sugiyamaella lignohabitans]ANB15536.1 1-phosphatidylinositol-3-phosphate 5-kinase [Sugiyamaella lignohabitans]